MNRARSPPRDGDHRREYDRPRHRSRSRERYDGYNGAHPHDGQRRQDRDFDRDGRQRASDSDRWRDNVDRRDRSPRRDRYEGRDEHRRPDDTDRRDNVKPHYYDTQSHDHRREDERAQSKLGEHRDHSVHARSSDVGASARGDAPSVHAGRRDALGGSSGDFHAAAGASGYPSRGPPTVDAPHTRSGHTSGVHVGGAGAGAGAQQEEVEVEEEDPEAAMAAMLGFASFDSTKGKVVADNQVGPSKGAVQVITQRKYRQYMNRVGGFNRQLDAIK